MHETTQTFLGTDTPPDPPLGEQLLRTARTLSRGKQAATQALVEDGALLEHEPLVRTLIVDGPDGTPMCDWDRLMSRHYYTLGLEDPADRVWLGLLLSLVPIGSHGLSGVEHLTERRLVILLRAIVCLAGSDRVAIGTGL